MILLRPGDHVRRIGGLLQVIFGRLPFSPWKVGHGEYEGINVGCFVFFKCFSNLIYVALCFYLFLRWFFTMIFRDLVQRDVQYIVLRRIGLAVAPWQRVEPRIRLMCRMVCSNPSYVMNDGPKGWCIEKFISLSSHTLPNVSGVVKEQPSRPHSALVRSPCSLPTLVVVASHPHFGGTIDCNNDGTPRYQGLVDNDTFTNKAWTFGVAKWAPIVREVGPEWFRNSRTTVWFMGDISRQLHGL